MITQEEAEIIMMKKFANEASGHEINLLQQWIRESPLNEKVFKDALRIWENSEQEDIEVNTNKAWEKVHSRISARMIPWYQYTAFRIAAVLLAFSFIGYFWFKDVSTAHTSIQTAAAEIKKVELPDGSIVYLHAFSEISYDGKLNDKTRNIQLKGLAFFDIKRDETKPFIIQTPNGQVTVLGTSFEVRAFEKDTFERVTVATGLVKFENKKNIELMLEKNHEGIISSTGFNQITEVNSEELISWKDNRLTFTDQEMKLVAEKLNRYFNIHVKFDNEQIKNCHFTGNFTNPTLTQVLDAISSALQLTYKHQADRVVFSGKGCSSK